MAQPARAQGKRSLNPCRKRQGPQGPGRAMLGSPGMDEVEDWEMDPGYVNDNRRPWANHEISTPSVISGKHCKKRSHRLGVEGRWMERGEMASCLLATPKDHPHAKTRMHVDFQVLESSNHEVGRECEGHQVQPTCSRQESESKQLGEMVAQFSLEGLQCWSTHHLPLR